ncbi:hypothetical protein VQ02_31145 [Methylobacterium variabile]|jgi:hypothetical protein|uniref:Uncharacterized protein n=1 Tax=Methylobacterium variabile TaxID=298794 RepID=A0A0J6S4W1_9HYPH|nr:hypothetical protein [Methylobacterium variabile]KMO28714.1 hypothetical protein VQ02_31145 [Methylobacterium variabile]
MTLPPPAGPPRGIALDEQLERVLAASQTLAGQMILLGLAVQIAWLEAWTQPIIDAAEARAARLARTARRDRLMRLGVPEHLAGQALRLVSSRTGVPPGAGQPP